MVTTLERGTETRHNEDVAGPTRARSGWRLRLFGLIALLLIAISPQALSHAGLRSQLIKWFMPEICSQIQIDSLEAGWFAPVKIGPAIIRSPSGKILMTWESATLSVPLWKILISPSENGVIHLRRPELRYGWGEDSDWDRLLSNLSTSQRTARQELTVHVDEARVLLKVEDNEARLRIPEGSVRWNSVSNQPCRIAAKVILDSEDGGLAELSFDCGIDPEQKVVPSLSLHLDAKRFQLSQFQSIVHKALDPAAALQGRLDGSVDLSWDVDEQVAVAGSVDLVANQFELLLSPLATGPFRFQNIDVSAEFDGSPDGLQCRDGQIVCEAGRIGWDGHCPVHGLLTDPLDWVLESSGRLEWSFNLPSLDACLPQDAAREAIRLTEGRCEGHVEFLPGTGSERRFDAACRVDQIRGTLDGEPVDFPRPFDLDIAVRAAGGRFLLDRMRCQSSFLKIHGTGDTSQSSIVVDCDLRGINRYLAFLPGSGEFDIEGQLSSRMEFETDPGDSNQLFMDFRLLDFRLEHNGRRLWETPSMQLLIQTRGKYQPFQITTLQARLIDPAFQLDLQSVPQRIEAGISPNEFLVDVNVGLDSLQQHWLADEPERLFRLGGHLNLRGQLLRGASGWHVLTRQAVLERLKIETQRCLIEEKNVAFQLEADYVLDSNECRISSCVASGESFSLDLRNLVCPVNDGPLLTDGTCQIRASLSELCKWFRMKDGPSRTIWNGTIDGRWDLETVSESTTCRGNLYLSRLSAIRTDSRTGTIETQRLNDASLVTDMQWDWLNRTCHLRRFQLSGFPVALNLSGRLDARQENPGLHLEGEVAYDWAELFDLLGIRSDLLVLRGRGVDPVTVQFDQNATGAQWTDGFHATGTLGWEQLVIGGLPLDPHRGGMTFSGGFMNFAPYQGRVGDGQAAFAPVLGVRENLWYLLSSQPIQLERVSLSPEICGKWMRFAVPLLADSVEADGSFSLAINDFLLPLGDASATRLTAQLELQQAAVRPAPWIQQYRILLARIQELVSGDRPRKDPNQKAAVDLLRFPVQSVRITMRDGWIYHDGLSVEIQGILIRSSGTVGLDEQLQLVTEFEIPERWFTDDSRWAGLAGQTLQIPVSGTLKQPVIDARILSVLAAQIGRGTLDELIRDEIDGQFRRLLDR